MIDQSVVHPVFDPLSAYYPHTKVSHPLRFAFAVKTKNVFCRTNAWGPFLEGPEKRAPALVLVLIKLKSETSFSEREPA